jgi:hypothetical protein
MDPEYLILFAQFLVATRGRKVDCLARCIDQTCCSINSIRGFFKTVSLHLAFIEVYVTPGCSGADTTPNGRYATMRTIDPRNLVEKR